MGAKMTEPAEEPTADDIEFLERVNWLKEQAEKAEQSRFEIRKRRQGEYQARKNQQLAE
jgi:hypothetical protein